MTLPGTEPHEGPAEAEHLPVPVARRWGLPAFSARMETRIGLAAVLSFLVVLGVAFSKRGWLFGPKHADAPAKGSDPVAGKKPETTAAIAKPPPKSLAQVAPRPVAPAGPKPDKPPTAAAPRPGAVAELNPRPVPPAVVAKEEDLDLPRRRDPAPEPILAAKADGPPDELPRPLAEKAPEPAEPRPAPPLEPRPAEDKATLADAPRPKPEPEAPAVAEAPARPPAIEVPAAPRAAAVDSALSTAAAPGMVEFRPTPNPPEPDPAPPAEVAQAGPATTIPNAGKRRLLLSNPPTEEAAPARAEGATKGREHVVAKGENFYKISRNYYGSGRYYRALHAANAAEVPRIEELYVGTTVRVPLVEDLDSSLIEPEATPAPAAPSAPAAIVASKPARRPARPRDPEPSPPAKPPRKTYVVGPRDTPRTIAKQFLGDPHREDEIIKLNLDQLGDNNLFPAGTRVVLPDGARLRR